MVHDAALELPYPLTAFDEEHAYVRVAAKTCFLGPSKHEARQLFENEAKVYDKMPRHLMDDYTGYVRCYPIREPVPVQAVVPKFYGYYVPTDTGGEQRSGIILQENCGTPIDLEEVNEDDM
jgi:hypothetical protein